ncbi:hypothetical protein DVH05_008019 [Phytophthora capsici]|nr:hypothetical protein DVH05_008019 [Phytophthora capsici]
MRRHFVFAEDEKERSVGEGKTNLLQLWHNRRLAMLEGDASANGGEANALVAGELTLLWDLAKPMSSCTLNQDGYVAFFARAAKALILPLSIDAIAITAAQRDWEYDLEGVGSISEFDTPSPNLDSEEMTPEQFREAVMQIAELVLPVESGANVYLAFFRELRCSIAEMNSSSSEPEQNEVNSTDPVDRFTLRPLNRIPKIANDSFLQKLPPSSDAMRSIRGLQPPDQREMSLKQLLVCYNPRKFSLTRAFPKKKANAVEEATSEVSDTAKAAAKDGMEPARRLHWELVGSIGSGATPVRGKKLHRETAAHWDPEDALVAALTDFPALKIAVVGPPGSGKTRLACVLARRLGLRYLSLNGSVQRAVDRKLRLSLRRTVIAPSPDEDTNDETPPQPEIPPEDEQQEEKNAEVDEDLDRIFRQEDLDAICTGKVLPRSTALGLLRLEATRSLLGASVTHDSKEK